jgi:DNA-binding SARP family transcriptional activator
LSTVATHGIRHEQGTAQLEILGPLIAVRAGVPVDLGPSKQRTVLALLLCGANTSVQVTTLIDAVWGDESPRTARKNLQVYMSTLRKLLGWDTQLVYSGHGYVARLNLAELDLLRFWDLAGSGRRALRAGDVVAGARMLTEAVGLRRGPVLAELTLSGLVAAEAARIESQYVSVCEDWAEAELDLGHHAAILDQLEGLVRREPYRERLRAAHLLALHRCGRQAEALAQFDTIRQEMAREFGLPPSPVLRQLYEAILADDPALRRTSVLADRSARPPADERGHPPLSLRLPRDLPGLIGRDNEVLRLLTDLPPREPGGLAVITGPPGVGKTALAVHVAHQLGRHFPDGQIFLRLRSADGRRRSRRDVLADLLAGVGWPGAVPKEPRECAALALTLMGRRQLLLVLDDAPDAQSVLPLLPDSGSSAVLVSSQRRLIALNATSWITLAPFESSTALEMLASIVGLRRVMAELDAAQRIVSACGLLPLTIRAAGARLIGLPHLPLAVFAARLADDRRLLDELTIGEEGIRSRLHSWYQSLSRAERSAISRIGQLPGRDFGVPEVSGLLATRPVDAEQTVEDLIEAHAIEALPDVRDLDVVAHLAAADRPCDSGARYRVPALIRAYAREQALGPGASGRASGVVSPPMR